MGLPRKLKNFALFVDGVSYVGEVDEVTLPKLTRKMEKYRAGGMVGEVELDFGAEAMEMDWKCAGWSAEVLAQWGAVRHDAVLLRFAGALQSDDDASVDALEIVVRGHHKEIDPGKAKSGDKTEITIKTAISYYKLNMNGKTLIEIDMVNMIEVINGVDRMQQVRAALGL